MLHFVFSFPIYPNPNRSQLIFSIHVWERERETGCFLNNAIKCERTIRQTDGLTSAESRFSINATVNFSFHHYEFCPIWTARRRTPCNKWNSEFTPRMNLHKDRNEFVNFDAVSACASYILWLAARTQYTTICHREHIIRCSSTHRSQTRSPWVMCFFFFFFCCLFLSRRWHFNLTWQPVSQPVS